MELQKGKLEEMMLTVWYECKPCQAVWTEHFSDKVKTISRCMKGHFSAPYMKGEAALAQYILDNSKGESQDSMN